MIVGTGLIVVPFCPLTRIFVKEYQNELMKSPKSVFDDVPFKFNLSSSRRDYFFDSTKPQMLTDPLLLDWLLGGDDGNLSQETDWTGLVKIDMTATQNAQILAAISGMSDLDKSTKNHINTAKEKAKELSKTRVMRQIRQQHDHMMKQYKIMKEKNEQPYQPSPTEFLCAFVLADEQKKTAEERQELASSFVDLMSKTFNL